MSAGLFVHLALVVALYSLLDFVYMDYSTPFIFSVLVAVSLAVLEIKLRVLFIAMRFSVLARLYLSLCQNYN